MKRKKRKYTYHPKLNEEEIDRIVQLYHNGECCTTIAPMVGCSRASVGSIIRRFGISRKAGGVNHTTEARVIKNGEYKLFDTMKEASEKLGYASYNGLYQAIRRGTVKTFSANKFRAHPGLDSMPTPRPFETFSREVYEARVCKAGAKVRDKYVTIPYEKIDEYHART